MVHNLSKREKLILEEVQQYGSVSIKDLAERLEVSFMTIHRDLNKLVTEGLISKSRGEALLPTRSKSDTDGCAMCGKVISERTAYIIHMANGERWRTCCAHCGLMLQMPMQGGLWQPMTTDFLYGHMISATQAFYVIQSELKICCVPSVLSFGSQKEAEQFMAGFGGKVATMNETFHYLQDMMTPK